MASPRPRVRRARDNFLMRTVPDYLEAPDRNYIGCRDILIESLARYRFVAPFLHGAVLDVGCGRGYGFEFIVPHSTRQVGADISYDFLAEALSNFPQIPFVCVNGERLPLAKASFDSIIAFEVIEHIEDDQAFLRELVSLMRGNAILLLSTPNRQFTSGNARKPLNPFHVREYTSTEFHHLLSRTFSRFSLYGQYEETAAASKANKLINRIPIRWKYLLPPHIQSLISVAVRPPLRLEDCHFETHNLDNAHTFVALCSL